MTIALSVKFSDGVVLATDSAVTLSSSRGVHNIYQNSNKIFNLHRDLPLGVMIWGSGSLGEYSLSNLIKDFREEFDQENLQDGYQLSEVASEFAEYLEEFYQQLEEDIDDNEDWPEFGVKIAGYSENTESEDFPETFTYNFSDGQMNGPRVVIEQGVRITSHAANDAIIRLMGGISNEAMSYLMQNLELDQENTEDLFQGIMDYSSINLASRHMPVQDAIDLADFLVEVTKKFYRFRPGPPVVGGPTEIASITKHENFKWIDRKHYYDQELNPEDPH